MYFYIEKLPDIFVSDVLGCETFVNWGRGGRIGGTATRVEATTCCVVR